MMLEKIGVFKDFKDGSLKSVFQIENKIIEMTLLFNKEDKDVVCVPTHHFCNLGCQMCHLTNNKLNKKMLAIKIDDFIEALKKTLTTEQNVRRTSKNKLLISFMGVGEPLLNISLLEEVFKKEQFIKEEFGYEEVGFALATMMPNNNLIKIQNIVEKYNTSLKIHFSLHNPIDKKRKALIPSTKVTVEEALNNLCMYKEKIQKNKNIMEKYIQMHTDNIPIEIHYTLIKNVNDQKEELTQMIKLLKKYNIPIKFIDFNETSDLKKSNQENLWIKSLQENIPNLKIKFYSPPGKEIGSSCGEFTKHYYHSDIETEEERLEFENWKKEHEIFETLHNC